MIVLDKPLTNLRADSSDRFNGVRYLYQSGSPITRLRLLGEKNGKWYYAAADDVNAAMPETEEPPIIANGRFSGVKV